MSKIKLTSNYYWCGDIHKYWSILFLIMMLVFGYTDLSQSDWVDEFIKYFTSSFFFENIGKNYAVSEFYQYVRLVFLVSTLLMPFIFFSFMYCTRKRWKDHVDYVTKNNTHFQYMLYIWFAPFLGYAFMVDILDFWGEPSSNEDTFSGRPFSYILTHSIFMNTAWVYMLVVGFCHSLANAINFILIGIEKEKFRK